MITTMKLKSKKATGADDIPAEIWKMLGLPGAEFFATVFEQIITENWTSSRMNKKHNNAHPDKLGIYERLLNLLHCTTSMPLDGDLLAGTRELVEKHVTGPLN